MSLGYDRDLVEQYAGESEIDNDREVNNRFEDLEAARGEEPSDPTLRSVIYYECIMNVDFDGDGIAERRRIYAIEPDGDHILHNEAFDHIRLLCTRRL